MRTRTTAQKIEAARKPSGDYKGHCFDFDMVVFYDKTRDLADQEGIAARLARTHNPVPLEDPFLETIKKFAETGETAWDWEPFQSSLRVVYYYQGEAPPVCKGCGRDIRELAAAEYMPACENPGDQETLLVVNVSYEDQLGWTPEQREAWQADTARREARALAEIANRRAVLPDIPRPSAPPRVEQRKHPYWFTDKGKDLASVYRYREIDEPFYLKHCDYQKLEYYRSYNIAPPVKGVQYRVYPPETPRDHVKYKAAYLDRLQDQQVVKDPDAGKDSGEELRTEKVYFAGTFEDQHQNIVERKFHDYAAQHHFWHE